MNNISRENPPPDPACWDGPSCSCQAGDRRAFRDGNIQLARRAPPISTSGMASGDDRRDHRIQHGVARAQTLGLRKDFRLFPRLRHRRNNGSGWDGNWPDERMDSSVT